MSAPLTEPSLLGSILAGRYEVRAPLGRGGMGEVFEAVDRRLGRTVAIKVVRAELAADEGSLARFRTEAATIARLTHPGIVSVYDIGEDGDSTFIVMEFVPGRTLARISRVGPAPDVAELVRIGAAAARALGHAHDRGIVHRDVSPGNVMVTRDGAVKILDFGIARDGSAAVRSAAASRGTLPYLAPEVLRGDPVDGRADVYALGAVLAELTRDAGDPALDRALARATAVEPHHRYITAAAFADALDAASPSSPTATTLDLGRPGHTETAPIARRATSPIGSATPGPGSSSTPTMERPRTASPGALVPSRGIAVARTRPRRTRAHARRRPRHLLATFAIAGIALGGAVLLGQVVLSIAAPVAVASLSGPEALPVPSELAAVASCDGLFSTGVDLAWDGTGPARGYEVWRRSNGAAWEQVVRVPGVHHDAVRDVDLGVDAAYEYRVRSFDGVRVSGWSNVAPVSTPFLCLT